MTDGWSPCADVLNHPNKPRREQVYTRRGPQVPFSAWGQLLKVPELAEGVETDAQPALFAAEGCNEVLGYLIGDCLHRMP